MGDFMVVEWWSNGIYPLVIKFFPHIQGFKSNQGSHVILVALICSINIEPFRKNVSQRSWTWHLAWELLPIALLLNLLEKNRHPDYLHYGCQSPQWIPQTIEIRVGPWFCDRTYLSSTRLDLRWILLCPNTFCDGSYFVQTLFAMDPTLSKHFLRWILLCPNTFCDGSYFVQTLFAMDPTLPKHFLRWILLCPNTFCDGTYPNPSQNASSETDRKPRTCLKQFGGFCAICLKWMW